MPLQFIRKLDNRSSIGLWKLDETPEELLQRLQLNDNENTFYLGLKGEPRRMHWLGSRVLLRQLLSTNEFIKMKIDENGKPALLNFPYELSLSHSYGYAAAMIGTSRVGIDIELIKDKIRKIAHRFTTEEEQAFINPETQVEQLYAIWSAKESLFKLYGEGQLNFRDHIKVHPFEFSGQMLEATIHKSSFLKRYRVDYEKIDGYMLAWVTEE